MTRRHRMLTNLPASASTLLADSVLSLTADALSPPVLAAARDRVLNTLGAGLAGRDAAPAQVVHTMACTAAAPGSAVVWGRETRRVAEAAALVNATQCHALELDDYHPATKTHISAVVVPTALAVAAPECDGTELLVSIVAAYDVMARVGHALDGAAARRRGWHMTGLAGPFGAAAVAGRLMRLGRAELVNAFGIAASSASGLFAFSREGAMTKPLHAGHAARAGIEAARLAADGFTGPSAVLEASDGGLLSTISDHGDARKLSHQLGEQFEILNVATKPYPCCGSIHSTVDGVLELTHGEALHPASVAEIALGNSADVLLQCGAPYVGRGGPLEAKMSLAYCAAIAVLDGCVGNAQFSDTRRRSPDVLELTKRVTMTVDEGVNGLYPRQWPARVSIKLTSGDTFSTYVSHPTGAPRQGLSTALLLQRFHEDAAGVFALEDRQSLVDCVTQLERRRAGELQSRLVSRDPRAMDEGALPCA
jgi:2-methylcitrate dehydratase PrpD